MLRRLRLPALVLSAVLGAIQLVPYGRDHDNPPVVADASWPDAEARRLAVAACYDCHSHETRWPAYSRVAPVSWLVTRDVQAGRDDLNFSRWDEDGDRADKAVEALEEGSMPPGRYELAHPDARLSAAERAELIAALNSMERARAGGGDSRRGSNRGRE